MIRNKYFSLSKRNALILSVAGIIATILVAALLYYYKYQYNRFASNTAIASFSVAGLTPDEAATFLSSKIIPPTTLILSTPNKQSFEIPLESVGFSYNLDQTLKEAKSQALITKPIESLVVRPKERNIPLSYSLDENKLKEHVNTIVSQIAIQPVYPAARLENKIIVIEKGTPGQEINEDEILQNIYQKLSFLLGSTIEVQTLPVDPSLTHEQVENYRQLAQKYLGKSLKITYEFQSFDFTPSEIIASLQPDNTWDEEKLQAKVQNIASLVNREPQNSVFTFQDNKVTEFVPSRDGLAVKENELLYSLLSSLNSLESSSENQITISIPVEATSPKVSNAEVNNLGIKELIGRGTSTFRGSIPGRVHNVAHAASKINGTLIKPGETLSFNQALGDVSKLTGYKEAYVIMDGRTVLGDGGGVCQVSTTFFRAAMNAGLPIAERRGHSYRVGYYEQDAGPGLDATVYAPTTDLKIVNDTPGHILVQAQTDTKNMTLVFEFYGTSDGRKATVTKPVITSQTAPPEDLYIDDPTLPTGQVKQIEHKAWGARTVFDYTVERNGEVIYEKTFVSNYRPWQAVFMRGTGPTT